MPKKSAPKKKAFNLYYLLAIASLALAAVSLIVDIGGWMFYITGLLAIIFALIAFAYKKAQVRVETAAQVMQAVSFVYLGLGILIFWVVLAETKAIPAVPVLSLSNLDYENYFTGQPVVELVILGSIFSILSRLTKPAWFAYSGALLMAASWAIWRTTTL